MAKTGLPGIREQLYVQASFIRAFKLGKLRRTTFAHFAYNIYSLKKSGRANRSLGEGWCRETESNHRHKALQASALPLSYPGILYIIDCS